MGPLDLLDHLLNFFAPALGVVVVLSIICPVFIKKRPLPVAIGSQIAINFIVGSVVLVGGLVFFGRDGKMMTYLVLVLSVATSQWWQLSGRQR